MTVSPTATLVDHALRSGALLHIHGPCGGTPRGHTLLICVATLTIPLWMARISTAADRCRCAPVTP